MVVECQTMTLIEHSKTRLVQFSDGCCFLGANKKFYFSKPNVLEAF
jgi:hypothetical protein